MLYDELIGPYGVYHLMKAVYSEYLYLLCNEVCHWSSEFNDVRSTSALSLVELTYYNFTS